MRKKYKQWTAIAIILILAIAGVALAYSMMPVSGNVSKGEVRSLYNYKETSITDTERISSLVKKLPYLSDFNMNFETDGDNFDFKYAITGEKYTQEENLKNEFYRNGAILFALVDDLKVTTFSGNGKAEMINITYSRGEFEKEFGRDCAADRTTFENFLKRVDDKLFNKVDSILPQILRNKLAKSNHTEVNWDTAYQKTATINKNIEINEPLLGLNINAEEIAKQYGHDLTQYYGKPVDCYIYDVADASNPASSQKKIFLSVVCDGKELYSTQLESDSQKQQVIRYIDLAVEKFLK